MTPTRRRSSSTRRPRRRRKSPTTLRAQGKKVGVLSPNVMRPFPADEFRQALRRVARGDDRRPRRLVRRRWRQSLARGAGRAPARSRRTRRACSRASTVWAARTSMRPMRDVFFAQAADAARTQTARRSLRLSRRDSRPARSCAAKPGLPAIRTADVSRGMAKVTHGRVTGQLDGRARADVEDDGSARTHRTRTRRLPRLRRISRRCTRSAACSKATWSCCSRPAARWW